MRLNLSNHDAHGQRAQYLTELIVLSIDNQLLANRYFQRLRQVVTKVDENDDADEEVRHHDLGAKREVKVNVKLDHKSAECDAKAQNLASNGLTDEPRNQVAAWHVNAAVQNLVVVRVHRNDRPL